MKPAEREALRQQARDMRVWARLLARESLQFRADTEVHCVRSEVSLSASKQLLGTLQNTVSKYAAILRQLDEPPDRALADAKQLASEATVEARVGYEPSTPAGGHSATDVTCEAEHEYASTVWRSL